MVSGEGSVAPAERVPAAAPAVAVTDRRAVPGTVAGALALVLAGLAIVLDNRSLLVVAALTAMASVILVLTAPDVPLRYRDRKARQREAERLTAEADQMAARAARFEAEAISAREQLATAMLGQPLLGTGRHGTPPSHPLDAIEALDATARRRHDDHVEADIIEAREREEAIDEVERLRKLHEGLAEGGASAVEGAGRPGDTGGPPSELDPVGRITDLSSGVFNQVFFDASLDKRVSAARRGLRPLTVALVEVATRSGDGSVDPKPVADILTETLREADTVARTTDGLFALLLEDTPENGAIWTLERIRRQITTEIDGVMVRAGVSCYPAYAFTAEQLVGQSRQALDDAREWNQDRIEVTTEEPDDA